LISTHKSPSSSCVASKTSSLLRLKLAATMQLREAPLNRRDSAMSAEPDPFQSPADLTLKGDRFEPPRPRSFLWAHRVFAVHLRVPRLNRRRPLPSSILCSQSSLVAALQRWVLVPICCCTAGEMGLRGGTIEGLLGRWVGGKMGELPVLTARATAGAGGPRPQERT
jgi:hypothetical protein